MILNVKKILWLILTIFILITLIFVVINTKKNLDTKSNQIEFLEKNLNKKKSQIKNVHEKLLSNNISLEDIVFSEGIKFIPKSNLDIEFNSNKYVLSEFVIHKQLQLIEPFSNL